MRKDGSRIWVTGTVRALRDNTGEVTGFVKLAREVTSKKFAELSREAKIEREQQARAELERVNAQLKAESERLAVEIRERQRAEEVAKAQASTVVEQAALLDLAQDAIFALRMDSTITYWNRGAEKMYGWRKDEAMGRNVHELLRTEGAPLEEIRSALVKDGQWYGEIKHYTRNGEALNVLTSWVLRTEDGKPSGWLEIARDVTEMRRLEEQMRESQKLESLGVLAGGVAHDFNNLLTGIMGNVSLAIELGKSGADVSQILENALNASEKAAYLTSQMLAYVGKGQFVVQSVDLATPVREGFQLVRGSIPDSVQVELDFRPDVCWVRADPVQLQQIAMNLILNAVESIGEDAGKVVVRLTSREIDDQAAEELRCEVGRLERGHYGVLEVHDTGPGIDSSIRPKIFDPFFTTKFAGRGLGLASTAGIVRLLHGAICIESEPGHGATFQVLLPMERTAETRAAEREGKKAILIVDDEEVVRQAASVMLSNSGYEVVLAENGQQAVDLFRQRDGRFALVLLDLTMPGMGGPQTLRQLKAIRPEAPVLISTGFTEETAMRRFVGADIAGFIQKPYTLHALVEKIRCILGPR